MKITFIPGEVMRKNVGIPAKDEYFIAAPETAGSILSLRSDREKILSSVDFLEFQKVGKGDGLLFKNYKDRGQEREKVKSYPGQAQT